MQPEKKTLETLIRDSFFGKDKGVKCKIGNRLGTFIPKFLMLVHENPLQQHNQFEYAFQH
jgi:hypothetical protein